MNEITRSTSPRVLAAPPTVELSFRVATMDDVGFIDALQKKYGKALGYFPAEQLHDYVRMGAILIAADLGYIISRDRYLHRDELGVIFQLCVAPGEQRKFVGAALVREVFERSAYGCRLYCCWCAQDLEANYFWESLGFVPLAFRAGSARKKRLHIFWQKKIVEGDEGQAGTKWWYPFQTGGGALREDRIVFPIPPGVHWSEVRAVEVPREKPRAPRPRLLDEKKIAGETPAPRGGKPGAPTPEKVGILVGGRIKYVDRPGSPAPVEMMTPAAVRKKSLKPPAGEIDPKFLAAARELRDRYLEHVNANGGLLPRGKYDLTRGLPGPSTPTAAPPFRALLAA